MIIGDYNEILFADEHSTNLHNHPLSQGTKDFQELTRHCGLVDMDSHGPLYTWCNKRENDLIYKKLDRVLLNNGCLQGNSRAYCVFEAGGCSDHLRCRIQLRNEVTNRGNRSRWLMLSLRM